MKVNFKTLLTMVVVVCATVLFVLYEQEAQAAPSLVGLWQFNEGSGTNILDSSGLGNNGYIAGENGNVPTWVTGQPGFGDALRFTNDYYDHAYVYIPAANSLIIGQTATNAWTITAWAYEDSDGSGDFISELGRILNIDDGAAFYLSSGQSGDAEMYTWAYARHGNYGGGYGNAWSWSWGINSTVTPLLDQWVHWAIVYDGTNTLTLYRNGNQGLNGSVETIANVVGPLAYPGYTGAVMIGSELDQPATVNWNGMLDDVAIFDGALTQSQIDTVMGGDFSSFMSSSVEFVSQPQSQSVFQSSNVTFSVGVAGQAPIHYQWYFGSNALPSDSNPTATNDTLVLNDVQLNQSGTYSVVVSNSLGSVTNQVTLSVFQPQPLVGLWRFNEGSGTNVLDSSGLGNNGYLASKSGSLPAWATGQVGFGGALSFTNYGTNYSYVVIPSNDTLLIGQTATNPWTITAWAYENSDGTGNFVENYARLWTIDGGSAFQFESGANGDDEMYTWDRSSGSWQVGWGGFSTLTPLLDQWVHWAVVYDGTNLTVYRDGNQGPNGGVGSLPVTAAIGGYLGFQDGLQFGSELAQTADRTWNGMLDDIAVFNTALTQDQIQTVMSGNFSAFLSQPLLSITNNSGNVIISWPVAQSNYQLQSTTDLTSAFWSNVSTAAVTNGNALTVTLPISPSGAEFFRLIGP